MSSEYIPITRAALSIRPMLIQKQAAQLRKDYQKSLRTMLDLEDLLILAKRLEKKYPDLITDQYGARGVSVSSSGYIHIRCVVNNWSDAGPILQAYGKLGYKPGEPRDEKYDMSRTFSLRKSRYEQTKILLILKLSKDNKDCAVIVKKYETHSYPVHEIVCSEQEAKLKTDMGGSWGD